MRFGEGRGECLHWETELFGEARPARTDRARAADFVRRLRLPPRFIRALAALLAGYLLFGKGFAYIGIPPVFVGELTLVLGIAAWLSLPFRGTKRISATSALVVAWMGWEVLRTIPYLGRYGADTLRDGALWGYALFALAVGAVVGDDPAEAEWLLATYRRGIGVFFTFGMVTFVVCTYAGDRFPKWPGSGAAVMGPIKGGDFLVHLVGAFAFLTIHRAERHWHVVAVAVGLVLNFSGRAGLLSFATGTAVALALAPTVRGARRIVALVGVGLVALWATGLSVEVPHTQRSISFDQLVTNLSSVTSHSSNQVVEGSKRWRLEWWDKIVDYTVRGPYRWTGKGFGVNLADDDGFQVAEDHSLRSPHNVNLTILARSGVPGLALWVAAQAAWGGSVARAWWRCRRRGDRAWANVLAFLLAYWAAFLVNATFDVFLEGPVGGIWFWTVFGCGLAAVRLAAVRLAARPLPAPPRRHYADALDVSAIPDWAGPLWRVRDDPVPVAAPQGEAGRVGPVRAEAVPTTAATVPATAAAGGGGHDSDRTASGAVSGRA